MKPKYKVGDIITIKDRYCVAFYTITKIEMGKYYYNTSYPKVTAIYKNATSFRDFENPDQDILVTPLGKLLYL